MKYILLGLNVWMYSCGYDICFRYFYSDNRKTFNENIFQIFRRHFHQMLELKYNYDKIFNI